jgi:hypothetical protein
VEGESLREVRNTALGQWWGFTSKWTPLNRGKDYEGSLVLTAHDRNAIGSNAVPAQFGAGNLGTIWSNYEWTEWDFSLEDVYWEQWLEKDRFMFRIGNQIPNQSRTPRTDWGPRSNGGRVRDRISTSSGHSTI